MSRASFSRISSRLRRSFSCCHVIITSPSRPRHVPATSCHIPAAHGRGPGTVPKRLAPAGFSGPGHAPVTSRHVPFDNHPFRVTSPSRGGGGTLCVISPAVATASSPSTKSCSAGRPGREPWVGALSCTARTTHHVCHQDCDPRDAGSPERFWRRPWRCLPGN